MYGLTIPQQNIWNLHKFYEGTSIANNCGVIFFDGLRNHRLLSKSVNRLVECQEGMRLRFREEQGIPVQYAEAYAWVDFPSLHFDSMADFNAHAEEFAKIPFAADGGQMFRFQFVDVEGRTGVFMCISHLIADAWAVSIIAHTIAYEYGRLTGSGDPESKTGEFLRAIGAEQDYLASERYQKDRLYWNERYPNRPELSQIRPGGSEVRSPRARRLTHTLSPVLSGAINDFFHTHNISQAVLFEAAVLAYLSRLNPDQQELTLGIPVLNRSGPAEKRAVGMFISTTALTVPVSRDATVMDLCREISRRHVQLFRHQKYPYSHILRDLHERYGFSGNLYDVIVSFQNAKSDSGTQSIWYSNGFCEVGLELHIDNRDSADSYTLNLDYQTELFPDAREISLLVARLKHLLEQMISNPDTPLSSLSLLPAPEEQLLLDDFNRTVVPYDRDICVHQQFSSQASRTPEKTALVFGAQKFTYRQIDEMSNSLAHALRAKGVGPGSLVPIIAKRSWQIIPAMLGVLKAGGAYMSVDPTYPRDRIGYMFEIARCSICLTCGYGEAWPMETISLEDFDYSANITPVPNQNTSDDLCYVIFTSGSTGKPKGVSICHRNVVNYAMAHPLNVCGGIIRPEHRSIVSVTNTIFDIFVTESLLSLVNGICIYLGDDEEVLSQKKLSALIRQNPIDVIQTTPTKMRSYMLDKEDLDYLKNLNAILLGGEALPADLFRELRRCTDAAIYNVYGPAETTVWSTIRQMRDDTVTIGRPIANTQVYILDQAQRMLPIGVAGELCISGDGVGKGYLNRPDLTAERFLADPFCPGQILYRTGDLARWRMDGDLEYLGRIDTQVKIRGLRIELGEIESVIAAFPGILMSAVTDKRDSSGRQYLVGYYTAGTIIDEVALRSHLNAKLPQYMVPNFLVHLDQMPMTASGKTDRKNLPTPDLTLRPREYEAPATEQEEILCQLLEGLLDTNPIGVTDDFFELGGDSLCAIEYVAQAHNRGIEIALQDVFDHPTVRDLCSFLSGSYVRKAVYDPADFIRYQPLLKHNVIDEEFIPVKKSLGNVLLTGATGFLGAHILDAYLREEDGTIYCLIRGGVQRLQDILEHYFGKTYTQEIGHRIQVLEGDITRPELAEDLPNDIGTVIHTAATVKHYGPWDYFHGVNVNGTEHVIRYAKVIGAKLLHISTISVSGNSLVDAFDVLRVDEPMDFTETDLFVGQPLDNVYIRSKFEAERAVLDAALEGLDARIIRVGNLTNRLSDFRFQPNYRSNAFLGRVRAALAIGALPDYLMHLYAEFSPIDQTAEGVIKIGQYADHQRVFHLNSHQNLYFDRMVELLNELGNPMRVLPGAEFSALLQKLGKSPETSYIYEALQNDLDDAGNLVYDSNIHIRNTFTVWFLEKLGFHWAKIDREYVEGYLNYFRDLDYFPAPK